MLIEIVSYFTLYTVLLCLFAPFISKYIDLLLLCCVNACIYYIIAYIKPGYIQLHNIVIKDTRLLLLLDILGHWIPLLIIWKWYQSRGSVPVINALILYIVYTLLVSFKKVYHQYELWYYVVGLTIGICLRYILSQL